MHRGSDDIKDRKYFQKATYSGVSYAAIDFDAVRQMKVESPFRVHVSTGRFVGARVQGCKAGGGAPVCPRPAGWCSGFVERQDGYLLLEWDRVAACCGVRCTLCKSHYILTSCHGLLAGYRTFGLQKLRQIPGRRHQVDTWGGLPQTFRRKADFQWLLKKACMMVSLLLFYSVYTTL